MAEKSKGGPQKKTQRSRTNRGRSQGSSSKRSGSRKQQSPGTRNQSGKGGRSRRRMPAYKQQVQALSLEKKTGVKYLDPKRKTDKKLRVMVLGGCEEVGRNCTVLEYDGDIIVIDLGLQFPEEDMPGIDYIIPNMAYLRERKKDVKGVVITHAHYDHIGGIPHVMQDLGNPIIYTGRLTKGIIEKRQQDFRQAPKLKFVTAEDGDRVQIGKFKVEFFHVNHNITNSFGIYVTTPTATLVHTGDFKFDENPLNDKPINYKQLEDIGKRGVDVLLADSTNAAQPGQQISEYTVTGELEKIFEQAPKRIIVGTFASNLNRIQQCVMLSKKFGRYVVLEGRSINSNVEIAHDLGFFELDNKTIISSEEYMKNRKKYPDNKICIVGTGAQGERNAFLMKYVNEEHRYLKAEPDDMVIFSSSVIPGNERTVSNLKDSLAKKGCRVMHYQLMDVHAGGHAKQDDLIKLMELMKPTYYVPIEQSYYVLTINALLAQDNGFSKDHTIVTENGRVMEFERKGKAVAGKLTDQYIPADYVFVDGLGVGDVSNIVLRDRIIMSQDGMVVIISTIDHKTGRLLGNPDIISRGFVYMKEQRKLIEDTRMKVKQIASSADYKSAAFDDHIKNKVREEIGEFLFKKTKRRPMVLPVVIKV